jgi:hypothetical protein
VLHIDAEAVLRDKAGEYSAVTKYLRSASFGGCDSADPHRVLMSTREFSKRWPSSRLSLPLKSLA